MGKRGPVPFPTNLRMLHGETRPSRVSSTEPQPREALPECPETASAEVREVWDYTYRELVYMGLLTVADRDALLCYCEAVIAHRHASALIHEEGLVALANNGSMARNPALLIQKDAAAQIRAFAHEFGLTPSARVGLKAPERDTGQHAERLLG